MLKVEELVGEWLRNSALSRKSARNRKTPKSREMLTLGSEEFSLDL